MMVPSGLYKSVVLPSSQGAARDWNLMFGGWAREPNKGKKASDLSTRSFVLGKRNKSGPDTTFGGLSTLPTLCPRLPQMAGSWSDLTPDFSACVLLEFTPGVAGLFFKTL